MNERDLKEKLHATLISKAKINDICEDLQVKYSEQVNQYNQTISLLNEFYEVNINLRMIIESERKAYTKLKESTTIPPEMIKEMKNAIEDTKRLVLEYEERPPYLFETL